MPHLLCKSVKISAVDDITVQKLHLKIHCIFIKLPETENACKQNMWTAKRKCSNPVFSKLSKWEIEQDNRRVAKSLTRDPTWCGPQGPVVERSETQICAVPPMYDRHCLGLKDWSDQNGADRASCDPLQPGFSSCHRSGAARRKLVAELASPSQAAPGNATSTALWWPQVQVWNTEIGRLLNTEFTARKQQRSTSPVGHGHSQSSPRVSLHDQSA